MNILTKFNQLLSDNEVQVKYGRFNYCDFKGKRIEYFVDWNDTKTISEDIIESDYSGNIAEWIYVISLWHGLKEYTNNGKKPYPKIICTNMRPTISDTVPKNFQIKIIMADGMNVKKNRKVYEHEDREKVTQLVDKLYYTYLMTYQEIGDYIGVTRQAAFNLGRLSIPQPDVMEKLEELVEISKDFYSDDFERLFPLYVQAHENRTLSQQQAERRRSGTFKGLLLASIKMNLSGLESAQAVEFIEDFYYVEEEEDEFTKAVREYKEKRAKMKL